MKKKMMLIILSVLFAMVIAGCQSKDSDNEKSIEVPVNEAMELESESEEADPDSPSATYNVKEGDYESFLAEYEKDFLDDGWEVTMDAKPDFLILTKGNKETKIMPIQSDDEIKVHIYESEIEESKE